MNRRPRGATRSLTSRFHPILTIDTELARDDEERFKQMVSRRHQSQ